MEKQREEETDRGGNASKGAATDQDPTRNNQENELEAEQESAAAMDSDVPQPSDASQTTEGQPS